MNGAATKTLEKSYDKNFSILLQKKKNSSKDLREEFIKELNDEFDSGVLYQPKDG